MDGRDGSQRGFESVENDGGVGSAAMIGEREERVERDGGLLGEGAAERGGEVDGGDGEAIAVELSDAGSDGGERTERFAVPGLCEDDRVKERGDLLVAGAHGGLDEVWGREGDCGYGGYRRDRRCRCSRRLRRRLPWIFRFCVCRFRRSF